ncbi:MAG: c-type cytochrome [Solirubrobacterales bacterium]|nr:c-type cytochrome [Solirubrobacterales bacterium]
MSKRLSIWIAGTVAVIAVGLGLALASGGADGETVRLGHGDIEKTELDRVLRAVEAAGSTRTEAEKAARGERLFNSSSVAKPGESCASCHVLGGGVNPRLGIIVHPLAGVPGDFNGLREAPALWDIAETAPYNWIGTARTLDQQAVDAVTTHFTNEAAGATARNVADLVAFMKTIKAPVTRHDQGRLTPEELAGEEIFVGKGGCIACHGGPQFTDNLIHANASPQNVAGNTDPGSAGIPDGFNTPHLRDLRNTAPYFHNGSRDTLLAVVDFYNTNPTTAGPAGLRLTQAEKLELVAYLEAL